METKIKKGLDPKKRYLQIALNSTLEDALEIIATLPVSDRIILEAGTPFIKRYGVEGIKEIKSAFSLRMLGLSLVTTNLNTYQQAEIPKWIKRFIENRTKISMPINIPHLKSEPYVVCDLKTMDRGETEVEIAASAGGDAAIALGQAPTETLNSFIAKCDELGLDSMIDMMNVEFPLSVIRALKKPPTVVIIHRGVDEERFNKEKQIPLHEIRRIKGNYNIMISIAGGDTIREVQRSIFNDADIVVVWKSVYQKTSETQALVESFLREIK